MFKIRKSSKRKLFRREKGKWISVITIVAVVVASIPIFGNPDILNEISKRISSNSHNNADQNNQQKENAVQNQNETNNLPMFDNPYYRDPAVFDPFSATNTPRSNSIPGMAGSKTGLFGP